MIYEGNYVFDLLSKLTKERKSKKSSVSISTIFFVFYIQAINYYIIFIRKKRTFSSFSRIFEMNFCNFETLNVCVDCDSRAQLILPVWLYSDRFYWKCLIFFSLIDNMGCFIYKNVILDHPNYKIYCDIICWKIKKINIRNKNIYNKSISVETTLIKYWYNIQSNKK